MYEGDDIIRIAEVAKMMGSDPKTVNRWAREGKISYFRTPGGQMRFSRRKVEAMRVWSKNDPDPS